MFLVLLVGFRTSVCINYKMTVNIGRKQICLCFSTLKPYNQIIWHSHLKTNLKSWEEIYTPTRFYWLVLVQWLMQFQACSIYILSMLIRFIFSSATYRPSKFSWVELYSMQHLFVIYSSKFLVLFLVSFSVYATPSFKVYYFNWLFHGILLCSVSFLKSQFHVKWICRNKFIIIVYLLY